MFKFRNIQYFGKSMIFKEHSLFEIIFYPIISTGIFTFLGWTTHSLEDLKRSGIFEIEYKFTILLNCKFVGRVF